MSALGHEYLEILLLLGGFVIVAVSSGRISLIFQKIHLPFITGLLFIGILSGPYALNLIPAASRTRLLFINDFALAFISFAAGSELYLSELRDRISSIKWITFGQLVISFFLGSLILFLISGWIPFMKDRSTEVKLAISLLSGAIFVARSPASAIAVIKELRARGPFTQTVMGVTVVKDFLVILVFGVVLSVSQVITSGEPFRVSEILMLLLEITLSLGAGFVLYLILKVILSFKINKVIKTLMILTLGFLVYRFSFFLKDITAAQLGQDIFLEPLVICIIGSFLVTNYSRYRQEFIRIIQDTGPMIYTVFFTFTGSSMFLEVLPRVWVITLALFLIRFFTVVSGAVTGSLIAREPPAFLKVSWMPYITQAGVALGLSTVVANEFPGWGQELATVIISVIVINQLIGPPLFKWALRYVGEDRSKGNVYEYDGMLEALIFGYENQAIALAKQLQSKGWKTRIATLDPANKESGTNDIEIHYISEINIENLDKIKAANTEAFITLLTDEENLAICEIAYHHYGTRVMVVRLNSRSNFDKFHSLGALIVEPSTAMVSLLDHFVRSPQATSLLLGMQKDQDTRDIEIRNPNLHGIYLRDLRLPPEVIVLSVKRRGQMIISHGYTRLRRGDVLTLVGTLKSLDHVSQRFES